MEESNFHQRKFSFLMMLGLNPVKFENFRRNLSDSSSLANKFSVVWKLEEAHKFFTPTLIESGKSKAEAIRLRNEGNACFRKRNLVRALQLYNLSIMNAPHPVVTKKSLVQDPTSCQDDCFVIPHINPANYGGTTGEHTDLAMAYANRSAIMFELGLYEKCLKDINLALIHGYPKDRCEKLESRKRKCLGALKDRETFVDGAVKMPQMHSPEDSTEHYGFDSVALLDMFHAHPVLKTPTLKELISFPKMKPRREFKANPKIPAISSALRIEHVPPKGRGVVAVRDIQPGEVLGVERAYYAALKEDMLSFFCSNCMLLSMTPLPCPGCCKVIFCSESCRDKGLAEEHWIECKILPTLTELQLDTIGTSYKLLKTFTYQQVNAIYEKAKEQKTVNLEKLGCNEKGIYDSTSYQTVLNLCINEKHRPFESMVVISLTSVVLTKLLILSGRYFVNSKGEPVTPTERDLLQTGAVLISNVMEALSNTFRNKTTQDKIGTCLFPTFSLINHSCDPAVRRLWNGREMILRAVRPISAGQEITISYCMDYAAANKGERTSHLNHFYFKCDCEACENDWPTVDILPEFRLKCSICGQEQLELPLMCQLCTIQSSDFQKQENMKKTLKNLGYIRRFVKIREKMKSDQPVTKDDFGELCKLNELFHKCLAPPCSVFVSLYSIMERFFQGGF